MYEDNRKAWEREYSSKGLPTSRRETPSRAAEDLLEFLTLRDAPVGRALELGCGYGRNAVLFARSGYHTTGVDFVPAAEQDFARLAEQYSVSEKMTFRQHDLREPLPFPDGSFQLVYGMTAIENLVEDEDLEMLCREISRVLAPNGFFGVYFLTNRDGFYGPRIDRKYAPRKLVWAEDANMLQRVFTPVEVQTIFSSRFEQVDTRHYAFEDQRYGETYMRDLHMSIFQKS